MGAQVLLQQGSGPEGSRQSIARGAVARCHTFAVRWHGWVMRPVRTGDEEGPMLRRSLIPMTLAFVLAACANASTGAGSGGVAEPPPVVDQRRVGVYAS